MYYSAYALDGKKIILPVLRSETGILLSCLLKVAEVDEVFVVIDQGNTFHFEVILWSFHGGGGGGY